MAPLPAIPNCSSVSMPSWSNYHATIAGKSVPDYATPGFGLPIGAATQPALSQALNAILQYCFGDPPQRICTLGATWSMSSILSPDKLILDPGAWNQVSPIDPGWITPGYKAAAAPRGGVPVLVQGGTSINTLNSALGLSGLALQTSGAADGHRIAGCIATGTHGSDLKVGAVHDSVRAVYLVVAPNQAVLVQPATPNFTSGLATSLQAATALATAEIHDDDVFGAALVALGGLGFVHSVVVEAVPLYQFIGTTWARTAGDPAVWKAIDALDFSAFDPGPNPDFFTVVFSPFAKPGDAGSWTTILRKQPATGHVTGPALIQSAMATDLARLLSGLISDVGQLAGPLVGNLVALETAKQYSAGGVSPTFPGVYFGPTTLLPGDGRSSEVCVNQVDAQRAVQTVIHALQSEAKAGRTLLGGVGVRFVPASRALLGMNINPMNTTIEFPSLNSSYTSQVQAAVWEALGAAKISFTCHWGQESAMTPASIAAYYGDRVNRWKAARARLLPTPQARAVFTNPLLVQVGLA